MLLEDKILYVKTIITIYQSKYKYIIRYIIINYKYIHNNKKTFPLNNSMKKKNQIIPINFHSEKKALQFFHLDKFF